VVVDRRSLRGGVRRSSRSAKSISLANSLVDSALTSTLQDLIGAFAPIFYSLLIKIP
jgi:hypothetical protein